MYKNILLALDGSHASDLALQQAIAVAKSMQSEVHAFLVVDTSPEHVDIFPAVEKAESLAASQKVLDHATQIMLAAQVPFTTRLDPRPASKSDISARIVAEAASCGADLVVMGTHGRQGVARMVLGSVSEGVVSRTTRPVLLVRSDLED